MSGGAAAGSGSDAAAAAGRPGEVSADVDAAAFLPPPRIAVLDYGIGNLRSAEKALERVGADAFLTSDAEEVDSADAVVLPGVGAFGACMDALRASGLDTVAIEAVGSGRPFLGICVGAQMLFEGSDEDPHAIGLGVLGGVCRWLPDTVKRPQMQWNVLHRVPTHDSPLLDGLPAAPWVYFVHSLHPVPADQSDLIATADYGGPVYAAFQRANVFATQFHPEKSGRDGLALLANFVTLARTGISV